MSTCAAPWEVSPAAATSLTHCGPNALPHIRDRGVESLTPLPPHDVSMSPRLSSTGLMVVAGRGSDAVPAGTSRQSLRHDKKNADELASRNVLPM
jgi:hypothetical protein